MRESEPIVQLSRQIRRTTDALIETINTDRSDTWKAGAQKDEVYRAAVMLAMKFVFDRYAGERGLLPDATLPVTECVTRHSHKNIRLMRSIANRICPQLHEALHLQFDGGTSLACLGSLDIEDFGHLYENLLITQARRSSGAHYTPRSLTESTVQFALDPLVYTDPTENKPRSQWKLRTADEILDLKVCDIACGCGAFLLQACRYLAQRLAEASGANSASAVRRARQLVAELCLYGVDQDPSAVEIAKRSLWLLAEATSKPYTFLDHRIRCGDSLIDCSQRGLALGHPFEWRREFPEVFAGGGGFDAIIGNPPYVSLYARESQSANFAEEFSAYANDHLGHIDGQAVLTGRINAYLLFLVRSLQLLHPYHGIAALVLPDTILTNVSYEPMRRTLTVSGRLMKTVRYRDAMFRGASVGTAVVVCGAPTLRRRVELVEQPAGDAKSITVHESTAEISRRPHCSWLPQKSSHISRVTLPISGTIPIGEFAFVKDGINPGSKRTREWLLTATPDGDPSLRLCMEGKWISAFRITRKRLWVRYDAARLTADERKAGASLREPWIFDAPKIVYRQTAPQIIAAIDRESLCARNSVHSMILKNHDDTVLFALVAFLNSEVCRDYYQAFTGETRKTFPQVHIAAVKKLRLPEHILDPTHPDTKRLAQLATGVSMNTDQRDTVFERTFAATIRKINELVARMAERPGRRPARRRAFAAS
jgi:methylase of polypeptide subunit release factors